MSPYAFTKSSLDVCFWHPIPRKGFDAWILLLERRDFTHGFPVRFICRPPVVVLVDHLCLVKRNPSITLSVHPRGTIKSCPGLEHLLVRTEQSTVIRHVKHCRELDTPRIAFATL